jgi:hypothetical protein
LRLTGCITAECSELRSNELEEKELQSQGRVVKTLVPQGAKMFGDKKIARGESLKTTNPRRNIRGLLRHSRT